MAWQKKHKKDLSPARERSATHQKLRCITRIVTISQLPDLHNHKRGGDGLCQYLSIRRRDSM